jgi:hypothetical protein
LSRCSLI